MKILLINDDGYQAEGLKILYEKLLKIGEVTVVAPFHGMSAKSVSLTITDALTVDQIADNIYAVHGTPADCTMFALFGLEQKYDLVVSGCNDGLNLSYDVLFSGTIGGALTASIHKNKTVAFSSPHHNLTPLIDHFEEVWDFIIKNDLLSEDYVLNVNFPKNIPAKGIKIGRLYCRSDNHYFIKNGNTYLAQRDFEDSKNLPPDADTRQILDGYISIVPISRLPFDQRFYDQISKKVK